MTAVLAMIAGALPGYAAPTPAPSPIATSGPAGSAKNTENVVTFGIQPAGAKAPDTRGFFNVEVQPGSSFTDHVAVTNYSTQPLTLQIATADGVNTPTGGLALVPAKVGAQNVGTWIGLPTYASSLRVGPRSRVIIPFRVVVPITASPGDHFGGITATLQSAAVSASGQKFKLLQRVGTRLFARVGGALRPALAVEALGASYQGVLNPFGTGKTTVTYRVRNVGNIAIGGRQTVRLAGLLGWHETVRTPNVGLLLPGSSVTQKVRLKGVVPELVMTAHVSVATLMIPGAVQPAAGPFTGSVIFFAVPWTLIGGIVLLVWFVVHRLRRRRRRGRGLEDTPVGLPSPRPPVPVGASATARGRHRNPRVRSAVALFLVSCGLSIGATGPAFAESAPYIDPNANGVIGLCDNQGHQVTFGDIRSRPFTWLAVSSVPAPDGYEHGKAQLLVFQPRAGTVPDAWSGYQLTASSSFSNAAHPMAAATGGDAPLLWPAQAYPPQWGGYLQLRMYFTGPGVPLDSRRYPALNVRITGNTWTAVGGGKVDCRAGMASSAESQNLSKADRERAAAAAHYVRPTPPSSSSNAALVGVLSGVGVALLVAGGGWLWLRRHRSEPLPDAVNDLAGSIS